MAPRFTPPCRLDLELKKYEAVRDEIEKLATPMDVGYLRINIMPVKQELRRHVERSVV